VSLLSFAAREAWTAYWQAMRLYHRFEVRGLENLLHIRGPAMIVGYHGKPGARDLIMLQTLLLREHGQVTYAVVHDLAVALPGMRTVGEGMMMVERDPEAIAAVVARGEKLVVAPGGLYEAWGSFRERYRVSWRGIGYLKLAAKHDLPVVPVAGVGVDDAFYGAFNGYRVWKPVWERLHLPPGTGAWLGLGPAGFWPFSPPFPARIVQHIGSPTSLSRAGVRGPDDVEGLTRVHQELAARVQLMLDRGRAEARGRTTGHEEPEWVDQTAR
jgi:hypothetical protein